MDRPHSEALVTVRDLFLHARNSPSRLAEAVCRLCVAQRWADAARLRWSAAFEAALAEAGEAPRQAAAGELDGAAWDSAWEVGPGPDGRYSLQLATARPDAGGAMAVAALAAGLDAFLEAWQNNQSLQASLRSAEQGRMHFERLFNTVPVSTAILARDRKIIDANKVFCDRFGVTREQVLGLTMSDLGGGLTDEGRQRLAQELTDHGRAEGVLVQRWRPGGRWGQALVNAEMVDFDGESRVLVSSMDVTDMLEAETARADLLQAEAESRAKGELLARAAEEKDAAERLRVLADQARANLQRLSDFGRQVTASLDPAVIVATLQAGLPTLMPADGLRILVLDIDGGLQPVGETSTVAVADDAHLRELRRGLGGPRVVSLARDDDAPAWPHAPEGTRSALAAPLASQQGPVGLLVVYAREPEGHNATHRAMLETLALHVGSAISNSRAYAQLQIAQAQLVEREKMAALGSLVAGVAHELNTPLGNALLLASTLNERVRALPADAASASGASASSELMPLVRQASDLIERSLRSAAQLVTSFKQVAVDQTTDRRRSFDLAEVVGEVAATMHNQLQPHHHELSLSIPPGITMDSYPGALIQVLTNLMLNAIQHGLEGRTHGHIALVARRERRDEVAIEFSDDGCGISDVHLRRVFEPFFTTRLGKGGTGLGLSISYNIVTAVLGGGIQVGRSARGGAMFRIVVPLVAPWVAPADPPRSSDPGLPIPR